LFDNPSVAQQVSDTVRRIVGDTERIRENAGKISRASVIMERNFAKMVNSTSQVAANLGAIVSQLQNAAGSSANVSKNMGGAAQNANTTANNTNRVNTNLTQTNRSVTTMKNGFMTIAKIIGTGMVAALGMVTSAMMQLQKQGLTLQQNFDTTIQSIKNLEQVFRTGVIASIGDLARAQVALGRNLGNIKNVSDTLIESTVELTNVYGVSERSVAKINAQLFRWNGRSAELVKNSQRYVVALANANGQLPADIIEQMAENTDDLARFANQGAEGFARQVVALNKMGVSMKSISGLADRLVMDFEGSLESAARLQTFMPGFDMSGIQFAAQFGTNEQIATELQTALQRSGLGSLDQLPRSFQNELSRSLGMSLTEIQNLLTNTEADTETRAPTNKDFDDKFDRLGNSFMSAAGEIIAAFKDGTNRILAYLALRDAHGLVKGKLFKNLKRTKTLIGSRGTVSTAGKFARTAARFGGAAPIIGAGVSLATGGGIGGATGTIAGGAVGAVLGSAIAPGIGTAVGGAIGSYLGDVLGRGISNLLSSSEDLAQTNAKAVKVQKEQTKAMEDATEASKFEAELKQAAARAGVKDFNFAMGRLMQSQEADATPGVLGWIKSKFAGVFHKGGVVGDKMGDKGNSLSNLKNLKPQETIAILEKGEVVLTPSQMSAMGRALGGGMRGNISNITNGFMSSFNVGSNKIVQSIRGSLTDKGGFLGKIGNFFEGSNIGQTVSTKLAGITDKLAPIKNITQGFTGGLMDRGKSVLGRFLQNKSGDSGIMSRASSLFGENNAGSLMDRGKSFLTNKASGLISKFSGSSSSGLLGKIAGLTKGGAIKGTASKFAGGALSKMGGAKMGAMLGSVIPGAGTVIGAALGMGISRLASSGVGKTIGGAARGVGRFLTNNKIVNKTPLGLLARGARSYGGVLKNIGGRIGGLFGRRRKESTSTDLGSLSGAAGMTPGIQGMPNILSMFGGVGDAGLGATVTNLPRNNISSESSTQVKVDNTGLENKMDQLINLMRSGGIAVNLDGRKVSSGLMETNRYG
jgi:outer membrane lipoprotein SlyB